MSGSKRIRKGFGEFKQIKDQRKRNNPQSLRRTLYDATLKQYGDAPTLAAAKLSEALRTREGRTLHSSFSAEILYNILSDRSHIKYYHLEGYARDLGVPVSLILFYSRLTANQSDGASQSSKAMLRAYRSIIGDAVSKLTGDAENPHSFTIEDLLRWVEIYKSEQEQLQLFEPSND
jgi:hypothetical protein